MKACLFSMGVLMGLLVPFRKKKWAALGAGLVFLPTYVLLLRRFLPFLLERDEWEDESAGGGLLLRGDSQRTPRPGVKAS